MDGLLLLPKCKRRVPSRRHRIAHLARRSCKILGPVLSEQEAGKSVHAFQMHHLSTFQAATAVEDDVGLMNSSIMLFYDQIRQPNIQVHFATYGQALEQCLNVKDGNHIHDCIVQERLEHNSFLGSRLLYMYLKCGAFEDALAVFINMRDRILYAWNTLIQACPEQARGKVALELFEQMQEEAVMPNKVTFLSVVYGCSSEIIGKQLHARFVCSAFNSNLKIGTSFLNMYGRFGRLDTAWNIFENMPQRDAFAWSAMIVNLIEDGQGEEAIQLFDQMQGEGITPNKVTFVSILLACTKNAAAWEGEEMYARIQGAEFESDVTVQNVLINMFGKCDNLEQARTIFDAMPLRSVVTWTSMISLYAQKGYAKAALFLFHQMQCEAMAPNKVTFVNVISACANDGVLDEGKRFHSRIWDSDVASDAAVVSALVNMYGKCGSVVDSLRVFTSVNQRDLVLWNTMLTVYSQNQLWKDAIQLFEEMQEMGLNPDKITFVNVLLACAGCARQSEGERMHNFIMESGLELEGAVANALIHMYAQCGNLSQARGILNQLPDCDAVSWTVLIAGYTSNAKSKEAIQLLDEMLLQGVLPDKVTFVSILDACASGATHAECQKMHARILSTKDGSDVCLQNVIINTYGKCGSMTDAQKAFDTAIERDLITWNAIMTAYVQDDNGEEALNLFVRMLGSGLIPDRVTFIIMFSACASQTLLTEGQHIHSWVLHSSCDSDVIVQTALITMYGKCGSLEDARELFSRILEQNVFSWNAIIAAYAQHGLGKETVELFLQMQQCEVRPDAISFLAVLTACSHSGLVDEGRKFFTSMKNIYNIQPWAEHHACMIDLLGRAACLDEAECMMIDSLTHNCTSSIASITTMLSACSSKYDIERGERVAKHALELNLDSSAIYVILSNIYSAISKKDATTVKTLCGARNIQIQHM